MVVLITSSLLITAFLAHVLWWRIRIPQNPTLVLLFMFFCVLAVFIMCIMSYYPDGMLTPDKIVQLCLLYSSSALVYIILYSAIEQQSPTLAIVSYIHQCGSDGCDEDSLRQYICPDAEISKRVSLIQQSGWIRKSSQQWSLTRKGEVIGWLFHHAAIIFGLQTGG